MTCREAAKSTRFVTSSRLMLMLSMQ